MDIGIFCNERQEGPFLEVSLWPLVNNDFAMIFPKLQRIVIKVGTGILTAGMGKLHIERIQSMAEQISILRQQGIEVIVVSSGAIGFGMGLLGHSKRSRHSDVLRACAALGQPILMETWKAAFNRCGIETAQVLLTRDDVGDRQRHVSLRETFEKLIELDSIPIVNENDSISTEEITFIDNDALSALVASFLKAELLVVLSTIPGLLDLEGDGKLIPVVEKITPHIRGLAKGTNSPTAVGGMKSKIDAAEIAIRSGCGVFITSGEQPDCIARLIGKENRGTFFVPQSLGLSSKKRWLAFFQSTEGVVRVNAGAKVALLHKGSSLLARGIVSCKDDFAASSFIAIEDEEGQIFARGFAQFSSKEITTIAGYKSEEIAHLFPDRKHLEVVHRDEMVMLPLAE